MLFVLNIEAKGESEGWSAVYAELCSVDPLAGEKFKVSDKQRIIRALEVYKLTGQPITKLQAEQPKNVPYRYNFHNYALMPDRARIAPKNCTTLENYVGHRIFE